MKRLFISQPMNGKTDEDILVERERIINACKDKYGDIEVVDSFFGTAPHDAKPLWYLGKSLELLSTADIVYFADKWLYCRECRIEHTCAYEYGIVIARD